MTEPDDDAPENNSAGPEPGPGTDRWAHLRNTCPHGIVRGLITCPVCEPDKQAAAEASARAAVARRGGGAPRHLIPGGGACAGRLPGHAHCAHGHTEDCPDPGECQVWRPNADGTATAL